MQEVKLKVLHVRKVREVCKAREVRGENILKFKNQKAKLQIKVQNLT